MLQALMGNAVFIDNVSSDVLIYAGKILPSSEHRTHCEVVKQTQPGINDQNCSKLFHFSASRQLSLQIEAQEWRAMIPGA